MPYYAWQGINLLGVVRKGKLFAQSTDHLDKLLFEREIALLKAKQVFVWSRGGISLDACLLFFDSLKHLLKAGMRLHEALRVLSEQQNKSVQFQEAIYAIAHDIEYGKSLRVAFGNYTAWIDEITLAMLQIGQESGSLPRALELIALRLQRSQEWRKKIKSAAMLPCITFAFFLAITALIFTVIIPSFASLLTSRGHNLPRLTHVLLSISKTMVDSRALLWIMSGAALLGLVSYRGLKARPGKKMVYFLLLRIPFIGQSVRMNAYALFLETLSLIMHQGGHIAMALPLARGTVKNWYIQQEMLLLEHEVISGALLHKAMRSDDLFAPECCAMVAVGEETGSLAVMLAQASAVYRDRVSRHLETMATLIQPLLLLVLGLLVATLIFAIYIPLFQMPDAYTFM